MLQRTSDFSFRMAYEEAAGAVQILFLTLDVALESDKERPLSIPAQRSISVPAREL